LIAAALLQQLDMDYDYESWQPPRQFLDRNELVGLPRHGVGRSCKVGKEQIVGLLLALSRFVAASDQDRSDHSRSVANSIVQLLDEVSEIRTRIIADADARGLSLIEISLRAPTPHLDATQLARRLRDATPSVRVDASKAHMGTLVLILTCVHSADAPAIQQAFLRAIKD